MSLQEAWKSKLKAGAVVAAMIAAPFNATANDNNVQQASYQSVKADYIQDCTSNRCAPTKATGWSNEVGNWDGVAVSVRMGTQPVATDQEIKDFLTKGFEHFDVKNYKFFFEQNDARATGIYFHVRGGTSQLYTLADDLKPVVEQYSRQANNPNFAKERVSHDVE